MRVSIVFPAYNEELNIDDAVKNALAFLKDQAGEIIVINDGSRDKTRDILQQLSQAHPDRIRLIHHSKNLGYAASLRDGFSQAKGDWIFYTDSDHQFDLNEIDLLFDQTPDADIVVGYRKDRKDPELRKFAAGIYNFLIRMFFRIPLHDVDCAFKLFHRKIFKQITIESNGFLVDAEIMTKAYKLGFNVQEVVVTHRPRRFGNSTVRLRHVFMTLIELPILWYKVFSMKNS